MELTGESSVWAEVDRDGHLLRCDAALAAIQEAAGGTLGGPIAVPQLARLVAMVLATRQVLAEDIIAARQHDDVSIRARAMPTVGGALIEMTDWRARAIGEPTGGELSAAAIDILADPRGTAFQLDGQLALLSVSLDRHSDLVALWRGRSISEMFRLQPDSDGHFPLLRALAIRDAFAGQSAITGEGTEEEVFLQGWPIRRQNGEFAGYYGIAMRSDSDPEQIKPGSSAKAMEGEAQDLPDRIDAAMREPLDRIVASAQAIASRSDGPIRQDYANYAADIAVAARHLIALVDDLGGLKTIDEGVQAVSDERVDLVESARQAVALLAVKADERAISVELPADSKPVHAAAELRRVLQILINLVGNAIRYSPEGSTIRITASPKGRSAWVTVADEGPGLSAVDQEKLFDKFERLGRSDPLGSGLGLYIARKLARVMGGDISVESVPGEGASFTLTLPSRR